MKRKIFSILLVLALVCGLSLVTAAPVAAEATSYEGMQFQVDDLGTGEGSAGFVQDTYLGDYVVSLATGDPDVSEQTDYAAVVFPCNLDISAVDSFSYSYKLVEGNMGDYWDSSPYAVVALDTTGGGSEDTWIIHNMFAVSATPHDWLSWDSGTVVTPPERMATGNGTDMWFSAGTVEGDYVDWDAVVAALSGDVLKVKIAVGEWESDINTAYLVDDFELNGTLYDLEPVVFNGTAGYATIQDAIDAASASDTISVADGIYAESLVVDTADLTLESVNGRDSTTIQNVGDVGEQTGFLLMAGATDFTLGGSEGHGFTIEGGIGTAPRLIQLNNGPSSVELSYNAFDSSDTAGNITTGINIGAGGATGLTVDNNIFTADEDATYQDWPLTSGGPLTNLTVTYNEFTGSGPQDKYGAAIDLNQSNEGTATLSGGTITNNTISGFDRGILTGTGDAVVENLDISQNEISGCGRAILFRGTEVNMASVTVTENNFHDNTFYGIDNATAATVDATNNYWGDASGPEQATPLPEGYESYGDKVSDDVIYEPWLLVADGDTYEKTLALREGWTLVSTDQEVGSGTDWVDTIVAYEYTGSGYTQVEAIQLRSVDAYYVKTDGGGGVGINYSTSSPGVVTKTLVAGWNIISCAAETDAYTLLTQLRHVQIGEQEGVGITNLIGQGSYNQFTPSISAPLAAIGDWDQISEGDSMTPIPLNAFDGYWVYMNAAKSFGVIPD